MVGKEGKEPERPGMGGSTDFDEEFLEAPKEPKEEKKEEVVDLIKNVMEKVFTITPVWRAEKHNTIRHLNESRQMDIEMAFSGQKEVIIII